MAILRIISGGQTGCDRAALDAAIALGISHGGYVPKGRLAEDGIVPHKYSMQEISSRHYQARTKKNVDSATATLVFATAPHSKGVALTIQYAQASRKPCLVVPLENLGDPLLADKVVAFLKKHSMAVINVAGPRESSFGGGSAYQLTYDFLLRVLPQV